MSKRGAGSGSKELTWVATASKNAMISGDELKDWLGLTGNMILRLEREQSFPPPRIYPWNRARSGLRRCRWRVGDVRAWLARSDDFEAELAKGFKDPNGINFRREQEARKTPSPSSSEKNA